MSAVPARFNGFTKRFGTTPAVEDLSFAVPAGRVVGLLGRNGAGKTTSLRGLLGLVKPTAGIATVFGLPYAALPRPAHRVGVSMAQLGWATLHSGHRHLSVCARAAGVPPRRVTEVLDLVGLSDAGRRPVRHYSDGMRQRLSLATALLGDPELLVLDEPANGLDPDGILWLRKLLRSLATEGRTVLVSSHHLSELELTVDDVVVIQQRLLFAGPLAELTRSGDVDLERRFFDLVGPIRTGVGDA